METGPVTGAKVPEFEMGQVGWALAGSGSLIVHVGLVLPLSVVDMIKAPRAIGRSINRRRRPILRAGRVFFGLAIALVTVTLPFCSPCMPQARTSMDGAA